MLLTIYTPSSRPRRQQQHHRHPRPRPFPALVRPRHCLAALLAVSNAMPRPRYSQSSVSDARPLARPLEFEFSKRVSRSRIFKASMTERLASWSTIDLSARGIPTEEIINAYRWFGNGGLGVILTGNLIVDAVNIEGAGNLIIPPDAPF
ncbi:hypothetical protein D6D13_10644 [Aureobasidium pullulans]|uniref:NADH:flavin oxidoreductase/NADH oxidase N-terminal domain-containing protein n=1 Tax=Aureobasidium pullulans TaxID=5580 RepID=A0A4V4IXS8_AURPU|nr:hypothetical protein D6D13_10644 [Aureobasidium pullulans]